MFLKQITPNRKLMCICVHIQSMNWNIFFPYSFVVNHVVPKSPGEMFLVGCFCFPS